MGISSIGINSIADGPVSLLGRRGFDLAALRLSLALIEVPPAYPFPPFIAAHQQVCVAMDLTTRMDRVLRIRWSLRQVLAAAFIACCFASLWGCSHKEPEVREYTVKNLERGKIKGVPPVTKWRTLGAIAFQGESGWFFKISDEPAIADKLEAPLTDFLKALKFDEQGAPVWQLASGWTERPGDQFRYRTIVIPVEGRAKPVELTVSKLEFNAKDKDRFVLDNVNRWRGQLALNPRTKDALPKDFTIVATAAGSDALVVNYLGNRQPTGMGAGMPMMGSTDASEPPPTRPAPANASAEKLTFKPPASWVEKGAGGMRKAAFDVGKGEEAGEVTVIDLTGTGGDLLPNLNRWRGQVGLPSVSEEEMNSAAFEIASGDKVWKSFRLEGSKDGKPVGILVATWKSEDRAWFIKLQGTVSLLKEEEGRFIEFVKSFQVKS